MSRILLFSLLLANLETAHCLCSEHHLSIVFQAFHCSPHVRASIIHICGHCHEASTHQQRFHLPDLQLKPYPTHPPIYTFTSISSSTASYPSTSPTPTQLQHVHYPHPLPHLPLPALLPPRLHRQPAARVRRLPPLHHLTLGRALHRRCLPIVREYTGEMQRG